MKLANGLETFWVCRDLHDEVEVLSPLPRKRGDHAHVGTGVGAYVDDSAWARPENRLNGLAY